LPQVIGEMVGLSAPHPGHPAVDTVSGGHCSHGLRKTWQFTILYNDISEAELSKSAE